MIRWLTHRRFNYVDAAGLVLGGGLLVTDGVLPAVLIAVGVAALSILLERDA